MSRSLEYSSIKPSTPIILASGSESRKLMLKEAGIEFSVVVSDTDEDSLKEKISKIPFNEQVVHLAKANQVWKVMILLMKHVVLHLHLFDVDICFLYLLNVKF